MVFSIELDGAAARRYPLRVPSMLPLTERDFLAQAGTGVTTWRGADTVWRLWGPRSDPADRSPVVLFHGGSGSWTHWCHAIRPLVESGRAVWVPDLPGFGESDVPEGGDADALVDPLNHGLIQVAGGAPVDLVGFSFGGMTAGMLAAAHPDRVGRLVLVGAPAMGVVPERQFSLKGWRHLRTPAEREAVHRHNLAALMFHDPDRIDALALEIHVMNVTRDRMPRRRLSATDILARALREVRCPVQAIYGAHDALYRAWIAALEAAFVTSARDFRGLVLIPDAGHWVQQEAPLAFNEVLARVLADADRAN